MRQRMRQKKAGQKRLDKKGRTERQYILKKKGKYINRDQNVMELKKMKYFSILFLIQ